MDVQAYAYVKAQTDGLVQSRHINTYGPNISVVDHTKFGPMNLISK